MTLGWKPDQKALKSYAFAQGVSVSLFTPELIAAFTATIRLIQKPTIPLRAGPISWSAGQARACALSQAGANRSSVPADCRPVSRALPSFSVVTVLDAKIQGLIAERWSSILHQDLSFWADYFEEAAKLCEVFYRGMKRLPFLEALVSRDVFRDVMEGRANA